MYFENSLGSDFQIELDVLQQLKNCFGDSPSYPSNESCKCYILLRRLNSEGAPAEGGP